MPALLANRERTASPVYIYITQPAHMAYSSDRDALLHVPCAVTWPACACVAQCTQTQAVPHGSGARSGAKHATGSCPSSRGTITASRGQSDPLPTGVDRSVGGAGHPAGCCHCLGDGRRSSAHPVRGDARRQPVERDRRHSGHLHITGRNVVGAAWCYGCRQHAGVRASPAPACSTLLLLVTSQPDKASPCIELR